MAKREDGDFTIGGGCGKVASLLIPLMLLTARMADRGGCLQDLVKVPFWLTRMAFVAMFGWFRRR